MRQNNAQKTIKLIITLLKAGATTSDITRRLNEAGLTSSRSLPFTDLIVSAEISKIRNPSTRFTSALYRALLMLLITEELTFKDVAQAFFSVCAKARTL